ncbi:MAG: NTP transferase domain-containing protein, partial [Sphingomonadaceae bacterium]
MIVGALLLAGGASRRFGGVKQLAPVDGVPMVARTAAAAQAAGLPLLLVTGASAQAVAAALPGVPAVHAAAHGDGLAESLKAGLSAVPADWG